MDKRHDTVLETLMEQLIEGDAENMGLVFARVFELAMQIERERFLGAQHYERSPSRQGYANGYKAKRIDRLAGTVMVNVPKTAGHDGEPFYPESLERGRRSTRAVMLAVAEMYVKGVSTREVEAVMREFGIESLSSSQVSRAAKLIDDELDAWRNRPLGEIKYLILDARYEKMTKTQTGRESRRRIHSQVEPRHSARENIHGQGDPRPTNRFARFLIDDDIHPRVIDLDDPQGPGSAIFTRRRLGGGNFEFVVSYWLRVFGFSGLEELIGKVGSWERGVTTAILE
jgi:hypothetical protein